jgi:hypothetical protein
VLYTVHSVLFLQDGWEGGVEGGAAMPLPPAVLRPLRTWMCEFTRCGAYNTLMQVCGVCWV